MSNVVKINARDVSRVLFDYKGEALDSKLKNKKNMSK